MRHVPARPEQTQFPLSGTNASIRREREALEQQRADLVRALAAAEQSVKSFLPGSLEQQKARARVARLHAALQVMKGRLGVTRKRHDLGELLIEICRERTSPPEWQRIVAEARRRHNAQGALKDGHAMPADIEPIQAQPLERE